MENQIWQKVVEVFPEANFLQSPEWEQTQTQVGEKTFTITNLAPDSTPEHPYWALAILRDAKRGRYLEIPCGPLVNWQDKAAVQEIFAKIHTIASANHCVFVRLRPQLLKTSENLAILSDLFLKPSPMHLAAEHTVMVDLTKSEDELLANLRRQTRYEVRRADKLGLEVKKSNSEAIFDEFYQIQQQTAARQHFIAPSRDLLQAERASFGPAAQIYITYASGQISFGTIPQAAAEEEAARPREDGRRERRVPEGTCPLAYGLILRSGHEADYFEAASTELNRQLPGAYALLWQAIKDLKSAGYERFNLWGIAPPNSPHHRYAGVTTFKTGFGGETIEYVPAHDLVLNKFKYLKNWLVETVRKKRRHL